MSWAELKEGKELWLRMFIGRLLHRLYEVGPQYMYVASPRCIVNSHHHPTTPMD